MSAPRCAAPSGTLLAIVGLLIIMAVSIAMAIIFPYVDLNAQQAEAEALRGGIIVEGIGGASGGDKAIDTGVEASTLVVDDSSVVNGDVSVIQSDAVNEEEEEDEIVTKVMTSNNIDINDSMIAKSSVLETASEPIVEAATATALESNVEDGNEDVLINEQISAKQEDKEEVSNELAVEALATEDWHIEQKNEDQTNESVSEALVTPTTDELTATVEGDPDTVIGDASVAEQLSSLSLNSESSNNDPETDMINEDTPAVDTHTETIDTAEISDAEMQQCHNLLQQQANTVNPKNILDRVEYHAFLTKMKEEGIGATSNLEPADEYKNLPYELKINFVYSSCMCPSTDAGCCVEVSGMYIGDSSSLDRLCQQTLQAVHKLVN